MKWHPFFLFIHLFPHAYRPIPVFHLFPGCIHVAPLTTPLTAPISSSFINDSDYFNYNHVAAFLYVTTLLTMCPRCILDTSFHGSDLIGVSNGLDFLSFQHVAGFLYIAAFVTFYLFSPYSITITILLS